MTETINLTCNTLDCWRKPEYPERTHADTGRTYKLHTQKGPAPAGIKPKTLLTLNERTWIWTQEVLAVRQQCCPDWEYKLRIQNYRIKFPESYQQNSNPAIENQYSNSGTVFLIFDFLWVLRSPKMGPKPTSYSIQLSVLSYWRTAPCQSGYFVDDK